MAKFAAIIPGCINMSENWEYIIFKQVMQHTNINGLIISQGVKEI